MLWRKCHVHSIKLLGGGGGGEEVINFRRFKRGGQLIKLSKPTKVKDCERHVVYLTRKLRGWRLYNRGSWLSVNARISAQGAYLIFQGEKGGANSKGGRLFKRGACFIYQFLASKWHYLYFYLKPNCNILNQKPYRELLFADSKRSRKWETNPCDFERTLYLYYLRMSKFIKRTV